MAGPEATVGCLELLPQEIQPETTAALGPFRVETREAPSKSGLRPTQTTT